MFLIEVKIISKMDMEQFNLHKLVNLRKRFDKYDCPCSEELRAVIDKHMAIQKEISLKKSAKKRDEYQYEMVECPHCDKEVVRHYLYKHKISCKKKSKPTVNDATTV